jgi:hypothetical protein
MKYFHLDFKGERVDGEIARTGSYGRYKITAEKENGDTFSMETTDSEVYDYIDDEYNEEKRGEAEEWILYRFENESNWRFKATYKAFPTNVTIFYNDAFFDLVCDFGGELFDNRNDLKEWLDDSLWHIKDLLNNYDDLVSSLCDSLDRLVRGIYED